MVREDCKNNFPKGGNKTVAASFWRRPNVPVADGFHLKESAHLAKPRRARSGGSLWSTSGDDDDLEAEKFHYIMCGRGGTCFSGRQVKERENKATL